VPDRQSVLIAMPTTHGVMGVASANTLFQVCRDLLPRGVWADFITIDSAEPCLARNLFATTFLRDTRCQALLFIDSDIAFPPALAHRLLETGQEVVGCAYPRRRLDLAAFATHAAGWTGPGPMPPWRIHQAASRAYEFTCIEAWAGAAPLPSPAPGFARMAACGMGATVIRRSALRALLDSGHVREHAQVMGGVTSRYYGFFDPVSVDGVALSEDYAFCYRWTALLKRDLWVCVDETINHTGQFVFAGRYADRGGLESDDR
jgi:hypothetical protein